MKIDQRKKILRGDFLTIVLTGLLVFSGCTKKIPYKALPSDDKNKDVSKSLLDVNAEYLYSASQQNSSRSAHEAFPYSASDTKRVKIEIHEESLRIVELEKDERFKSNTANNKLVLEIPITHVQYGCKKNSFGECTNTEEENKLITWKDRDTIRVELKELTTGELEFLPILSSATVGEKCYENVSSRLIKSTIDADSINFQVERVFKTDLQCLSDDATELSDATVSAIYHYSLVKTSSVLSKDYEVVSYPEGSLDEQNFGFFSSRRTQLDVDNNKTEKSKVQIMNRWNPNRNEIVYHLSDEFDKPENKIFKDMTTKAVKNINKGLEKAGVKFRINMKNPSGRIPGDIRNSMIVLVEDPVAASVIGYGPQTEDPVTGEIVSARTVMFLGTIKKFAKYTYDEIVREKRKAAKKVKTLSAAEKSSSGFVLSDEISNRVATLKQTGKAFGVTEMKDLVMAKINTPVASDSKNNVSSKLGSSKVEVSKVFVKPQIQKTVKEIRNYTARKNAQYSGHDLKSKIKYLHEVKNCAFAPAQEAATGAISEKLMAVFPANPKPWNDLSEDEKNQALAIILPQIWIPTLVHELGHNLGLRHNFAGSEDKDNFYSEKELADMGVDHSVPFSSVMDYGNDLKTLPEFGKYDLAALRFGYLRQVEVVDNLQEKIVEVPSTLDALLGTKNAESGVVLKEYQFCTDEHVGINAGCKRFDLGTSYTDIVKNIIHDYETAYSTRNLRDGRASFSHMGDLAYLSRINTVFKELRVMMEVVERVKYKFGLADNAPEWESVPWLKDLRQAALLGGSFLAEVILVPDIHCAVAETKKPQEIVAILPIGQIDPEAMKCQDLQLKPEFKVVGQAGKSFNSKKDPKNRNPYMDQIDVRGVWLDKVAAIRALTARTIDVPNMNDNTDNFLNLPEIRNGITGVIQGLLTNNVVSKVNFTMLDGSEQEFEIAYDMNESQLVNQPLILQTRERLASEDAIRRLQSRLAVNRTGKTPMKTIVANVLAANAVDPNRVNVQDSAFKDLVSVYKYNAVTPIQLDPKASRVVIDGVQYVADSANVLAKQSIELMPKVKLMEGLNDAALEMVLDSKKTNQPLPVIPAEQLTEDLKRTLAKMQVVLDKVDADTIQDYMVGIVKDESFYREQLQALPAAN